VSTQILAVLQPHTSHAPQAALLLSHSVFQYTTLVFQVYHLLKKMDAVGCDLFLDIHGDEEIPFNFLAGSEGIPSFNERLRELQNTFMTAFVRASPDFQPKNGYTVDEPGKANLAISSNGVSHHQPWFCMTVLVQQCKLLCLILCSAGYNLQVQCRFHAQCADLCSH